MVRLPVIIVQVSIINQLSNFQLSIISLFGRSVHQSRPLLTRSALVCRCASPPFPAAPESPPFSRNSRLQIAVSIALSRLKLHRSSSPPNPSWSPGDTLARNLSILARRSWSHCSASLWQNSTEIDMSEIQRWTVNKVGS